MTIAKRLYLLLASALIALILTAGFGVYQMDKIFTAANFANINTVPSLNDLNTAFKALSNIRAELWQHITSKEAEKKSALEKKMQEDNEKIVAALNKYEKDDLTDDKDAALLKELRQAYADYTALREKVIVLSKEDKSDEAHELIVASQATVMKTTTAFDVHREYNAELGLKAAEEAVAVSSMSTKIAIGFSLLAIAIIGMFGILLTRGIIGSLSRAVNIAETVASGDLTMQIDTSSKDEIGQLMLALKHMNDSLLTIVAEVRTGTDNIASASTEIATGNMDLSSRTEQQAGSLEETASSMEELTSTVRQNADNARQANQLAVSASEIAMKGGDVVAQVVDTMGDINSSAKKIVDIISVIDGIAFQTNILALNAAVEAARAGEQGRGFAVVASEVRNLAQRSASAAKEIKVLIDDSVEKVSTGTKLVGEAGATIKEVVESVKRVTDVVSEITAASQEQTAGIDQINIAITQMDETTQQNAALVEQAAAAAAAMQDQAQSLTQVVSVFKIDQHSAASTSTTKVHSVPTRAASVSKAPSALKRPALTVNSAKASKATKASKPEQSSGRADEWEEF